MLSDLASNLKALTIDASDRGRPDSSKTVHQWLPIALVGLAGVLGISLLVGSGSNDNSSEQSYSDIQEESEQTEVKELQPSRPLVESTPSRSVGFSTFTATGYVQAEESSQVAPKVSGRVIRVHVRQGDSVKAGQLLVELDPAEEKAGLLLAVWQEATAIEESKRARAQVSVVRANLAQATRTSVRAQNLSLKGLTSKSEAEAREAEATALRRVVWAARAESDAAVTHTEEMAALIALQRTKVDNLSLKAPFDGVVVSEPPHVGEYVGPQPAGVAVDMGGLRIANLSTLIVETDVPETRYRRLRVGTRTEITLDAFPESPFRGHVLTVTPEVNRAKATVRVKVAFDDPTPGVVPDLAARVAFIPGEASGPLPSSQPSPPVTLKSRSRIQLEEREGHRASDAGLSQAEGAVVNQ